MSTVPYPTHVVVDGQRLSYIAAINQVVTGTASRSLYEWVMSLKKFITPKYGSLLLRKLVNHAQYMTPLNGQMTYRDVQKVGAEVRYIARDKHLLGQTTITPSLHARTVPEPIILESLKQDKRKRRIYRKEKLKQVHPDLARVILFAEKYLPSDVRVGDTLRSRAQQRDAVARGASKTMHSAHLTGYAVDLYPLPYNPHDVETPKAVAHAILRAARELGVAVRNLGLDAGWDYYHFELDRNVYNWNDTSYKSTLIERKVETAVASDATHTVPKMQSRQEWIDRTWDAIQRRGSATLKKVINDKSIVDRILHYEIGNNDPINTRVVNGGGYSGPFQLRAAAWVTAARKVPQALQLPPYDLWTGSKRRAARSRSVNLIGTWTRAGATGGPADVNACPDVIVEFWNSNWRYVEKHADMRDLPRTPEINYLLHNQGVGTVRKHYRIYKRTGRSSQFFTLGPQSREAVALRERIAQQLKA